MLQPSSNMIGQKWKKVALGSPDGAFNSPCAGNPGMSGIPSLPPGMSSLTGPNGLYGGGGPYGASALAATPFGGGIPGLSPGITNPLALSAALSPLTGLLSKGSGPNGQPCGCNDY